MKIKRLFLWLLALPLLLAATASTVALYNSEFETTPNGVHRRLYVPVGTASAKVAMYTGTGDAAARLPGFLDGPIVRRAADGSWSATWFCEDRVAHLQGRDADLTIDCAGKKTSYPLANTPHVPDEVLPMPRKVAVLSDIEGNQAFLDAALQKLGVTSADGAWSYGDGHLVIVGDAVDRGREVFGVLWQLYALSQQAKRAGGGLHLVLGNHEQYQLRGNISRANVEHLYALEQMGGQASAYAPDTVIGRWLRSQPVVLQLGTVLFTHGGISREVADSGLTVSQLNAAMRGYWRGDAGSKPALDAVVGTGGVTQYRGYLMERDAKLARASDADVEYVLKRFGATAIVVGHTQVAKVESLYTGRVYAVDVNSNDAADETLVFDAGKARVVPLVGRALPEEGPRGKLRQMQFADARDWAAIGRLVQTSYQLSRMPHPY